MKIKAFIAATALLLFAACKTSYKATDTTVTVTPVTTEPAFNTLYPNATNVVWLHYDPSIAIPIDWQMTGWAVLYPADYMARFDMYNNSYYAWYDSRGKWIGTTYEIKDLSKTPPEITNTIRNHYPFYLITDVRPEIQSDKTTYEVEIKNTQARKVILLDSEGTIIKEKDVL